MARMTGGEAIVATLRQHDVDTVFGLPGLPIDSFGGVMDVTEYDHIDVWRVLHGQRDIPAWMQVPDDVI